MGYKILVVDDNPLVRRSLQACIEDQPDLHVCAEAENGKDGIDKVRELCPDAVILDLAMPGMNGLDAARHIGRIAPNLPIVLFTMFSSDQLLKEAQEIGIRGVVSKSDGGAEELIACIRKLVEPES